VAKLPLNLSKTIEAWKEASTRTEQAAGIVLAGDDRLVELAQSRFSTGGTVPATYVGSMTELPESLPGPGEVLLVLVTPVAEADALQAIGRLTPKTGAVLAVDEGEQATGRVTHPGLGLARVSFSDSAAGWRQVFASCAAVAGNRSVVLAHRYPVLRTPAAHGVIDRAAALNALIGLAFFIPGADMPAMTLNQIKMVLSVAGIQGEKIDLDRAVELAAVVGMGFGFRSLVRGLARRMPGAGWALKPLAAFAATMAIGLGAVRYYEKGAPAATSKLVALVRSLKR
jgi:uncharacterized protein (DUF697 family)